MKIAVTAEQNQGLESQVAHHFGHAPYFILVDVQEGDILSVQGIANPYANAHQPGQIPQLIAQLQANVILSGGMGSRAIEFFEQYGIHPATGADGTVREAIEKFLGGKLKEAEACSHHEDHG
ncbi:MAG: NifB/NifX family molybdenum-iron cluster-binding protein [Anaerolineales bacterium]